jgi:hypothetical protein
MIPEHVNIPREILKVRRRRVELQGLAIFGSPRRPRITRELSMIAKSLYDLIHISTANANMRRHLSIPEGTALYNPTVSSAREILAVSNRNIDIHFLRTRNGFHSIPPPLPPLSLRAKLHPMAMRSVELGRRSSWRRRWGTTLLYHLTSC